MLPYGRQTIDEADVAAVLEVLRSPYLTAGPVVGRFEAALAAKVGARHASACANGTAALHLVYAAMGITTGDEIITTPITFSATAAAAYYVGATVRFADVDPATGNLDPASVEALITPRTRAIVPVHLGGLPVDLEAFAAIARRHGIALIEDACHALGASYHGTPIGSRSDATVFSFHPVKHITTGEGGAIVTQSAELKHRIDRLRGHGIERDPAQLQTPEGMWSYEVQELGWNYRLNEISCALGLAQLAKLDRFVARRREIAALYRARLAGMQGVSAPPELGDRESSYHLFAVAIDFPRFTTTRRLVTERLLAAGIGTQVHYIPMLRHPLHAQRCPTEVGRARPGADRYYARTLSLPMFPAMTDADVGEVVTQLARALGEQP